MKRCPECRRDYYDDTLFYCLDDGNALLEGPATTDEPATAILSEPGAVATGFPASESPTRAQIHTTDQTAIFPRGAEAEPQNREGLSERQSLSAHQAAKPQGRFGARKVWLAGLAIAVLILVSGFFGYRYFLPAGSRQIESIAVLPFENASGNADLDYLSDGVSESVIDRLSQLPQLKVIARSSSFRYRGQNLNLQEIANALGVDAIVTGRVVPRGDNYQIRVELVDVRENKQLGFAETNESAGMNLKEGQKSSDRSRSDKMNLAVGFNPRKAKGRFLSRSDY